MCQGCVCFGKLLQEISTLQSQKKSIYRGHSAQCLFLPFLRILSFSHSHRCKFQFFCSIGCVQKWRKVGFCHYFSFYDFASTSSFEIKKSQNFQCNIFIFSISDEYLQFLFCEMLFFFTYLLSIPALGKPFMILKKNKKGAKIWYFSTKLTTYFFLLSLVFFC